MKSISFLFVVLLAISTTGCGWVEKTYVWDRPNIKPEGKFTVRVKISQDHKLAMLEKFEPVNGADGADSTIIRDYFGGCEYFDENNWMCVGAPGNERVEMKNGTLTHYYWSEIRSYKKSYRLTFLD